MVILIFVPAVPKMDRDHISWPACLSDLVAVGFRSMLTDRLPLYPQDMLCDLETSF